MSVHADTAEAVIARLGLERHPEGGWYRETFRDEPPDGTRGYATAIYYLLRAGESSHWHRIDAIEIWHHYAGAPLELSLADDGGRIERFIMGSSLAEGQVPQAVVPPRRWQAARPLGPWSLAGCTVSPAFQFEGFEMAAPGWTPGPPR